MEISHEVLLTAWPLLHDEWLADTHADRIVLSRLRNVAGEWERQSRDPSYLYNGSLLQTATKAAASIRADPSRHQPLGQRERDFLNASDRAYRRIARRRHTVTAGLLALPWPPALPREWPCTMQANVNRQHAMALSRQLTADSLSVEAADPVTAGQLAAAAWKAFPTDQADPPCPPSWQSNGKTASCLLTRAP